MSDERLEAIDAKLSALLAIALDSYLRETGVAKPRPRTIDKLLSDAGLSAKESARLLGKSEQAVYQALGPKKKTARKKASKKSPGRPRTRN